jgi:pectate lyase
MKTSAFDRDPSAAFWGCLPEHVRRSIAEFVLHKLMRVSLLLAGLLCITLNAVAQPLAFPEAEGWGRFATGGRGGEVYAVTNLNDDGPGSLRDALSVGHRTVIFRISGTIVLKSKLFLEQSHITIVGQTAPGDGICLRRFPLEIRRTNDVIVRYLRIRVGDEAGKPLDGLEVRDSENIIIDHCSVSWSSDEAVNTWHGTKNLTVQWCLISEPLHRSVNRSPHGYGASLGGQRTSYHHNLFAHCAGRNPSIAGGDHDHTIHMDYRNNVIYNWQHRSCDGKPKSINVVNNYYKPGPATRTQVRRRIARIDDNMARYKNFEPLWHIEGNVVEGAPELTADNWKGGVEFEGNTNEAKNRQQTAFPFAPVATQKATDAYKLVLADVGANRPVRDAMDTRVLKEVAEGTATCGQRGIIDRQGDAGGWPLLQSAPAPADTDGDGMPDAWEKEHGLNPKDPADRNGHHVDASYSNLESYLNEMASRQAVRGQG